MVWRAAPAWIAWLALASACGGTGAGPRPRARAAHDTPAPPATQPAPPPPPPPVEISVLSYNVWFLPNVARDIAERAPLIPRHLERYDVVILEEAFDEAARTTVLTAMQSRGYTATPVLGTGHPIQCRRSVGPVEVTVDVGLDGGVVVLGRHRLEQWEQRLFGPVCAGEDCCAQKGVMYARFRLEDPAGDLCLHVFGTHLQSQDPAIEWGNPREVRTRQLAIVRAFVDEQARVADCPGPVLVAGDLNLGEDALPEATRILRARTPPAREGPCSYGERNRYTTGSRPAQLDWILPTEDFRPPSSWSQITETFREQHLFTSSGLIPTTEIALCDLSDHHPTTAFFTWER